MTFTVVEVAAGCEKVVGTIWAPAESEAQTLASAFLGNQNEHVVLRRAEERELPMKPFE